jgi:hypothetical protein
VCAGEACRIELLSSPLLCCLCDLGRVNTRNKFDLFCHFAKSPTPYHFDSTLLLLRGSHVLMFGHNGLVMVFVIIPVFQHHFKLRSFGFFAIGIVEPFVLLCVVNKDQPQSMRRHDALLG